MMRSMVAVCMVDRLGKSISGIFFLLTDWFARKNLDHTVYLFVTIFITGTKQVRSIIDEFVLQSGSVFYKCAKLTGRQFKHRVIFTLDGIHRVILN